MARLPIVLAVALSAAAAVNADAWEQVDAKDWGTADVVGWAKANKFECVIPRVALPDVI
jgi:hypothetical protein